MTKSSTVWQTQIQEKGYGILPDVFSTSRIADLISAVENQAHRRSKAGIRHLMSVARIMEIAHSNELLGIARPVLGADAVPFRATLFDTALPIRERREVAGWGPWSVKEGVAYAHAPKEALERVVALRLHLDDSDLDNGPLRVLPGTQDLGVLSDEEIHKLSEQIKPIECPVRAGGVVLMRPLVIHASSKTTSEKPRRVLHIEYAKSEEIVPGMKLAVA